MSDRIDHAAEALDELESVQLHFDEGMNGTARATIALTHATLALVEQQRIANLIALAHVADQHDNVSPLESTAWEALGVPGSGVMRPDIAAALGVER